MLVLSFDFDFSRLSTTKFAYGSTSGRCAFTLAIRSRDRIDVRSLTMIWVDRTAFSERRVLLDAFVKS